MATPTSERQPPPLPTAPLLAERKVTADQLLDRAKKVAKGAILAEAGIDYSWMIAYAAMDQRLDTDQRYGLTRYRYEAGPTIAAFVGGFFDHPDWTFRKNLGAQKIMRNVMEYEVKYTNADGYWFSFHQSSIELRDESIKEDKMAEAQRYDVWAIGAVRYALRVLGLRTEFYRMSAEDPLYAKLVLPALERRSEVLAAEDLEETLNNMDSHMHTQLFKAVATLHASNATKRASGRETGTANDKKGKGSDLGPIPQAEEDLVFGRKEIEEGFRSGIFVKVSEETKKRALAKGAVVSSRFVVWRETEDGKQGRFIINLTKMSKHWPKGSVRLDGLAEFGSMMMHGDRMISLDIQKGYQCLRLHPAMREWFIFHHEGKYYQCIALPFGWGRSPLWFCNMMAPLTATLRIWGYRVLGYIDDFLVAPAPHGSKATMPNFRQASKSTDLLLDRLGVRRHPGKGTWDDGTTRLEHLGVIVDSQTMTFEVTESKADRIRDMGAKFLKEVVIGRHYLSTKTLQRFCGCCVCPQKRFSVFAAAVYRYRYLCRGLGSVPAPCTTC